MKFTELDDYPLAGGIVMDWTPTTDTPPTSWEVDPRPLSYDHEKSVRAASSTASKSQSSWIGAAFEIPRRFDQAALRCALRGWTMRHDALRTTAGPAEVEVASRTRPPLRRTYHNSDLDVPPTMVGHLRSGHSVRQYITSVFDAELTASRWPHHRVVTICPLSPASADDRFLVVFGADHVAMDAYSLMLSMQEIQYRYVAALDRRETALPHTGSHIEFSRQEREVGEAVTEGHPAVQSWTRFLGAGITQPGTAGLAGHRGPCEAPSAPLAGVQRGYSDFIATDTQASAISREARTLGFNTPAMIFAALALAYQDVTGDRELRVVMPWHTRREAQYVDSVGWYVGLGPLEVDLSRSATFVDALTVAARAVASAKESTSVPYRRAAELIGIDGDAQFVVSYLDLRHIAGAEHWPTWRAQALRGRSGSDREVYVWIARVPTGVTLSARFPDSPVIAERVDHLIRSITAIISALAADGLTRSLQHYTRPDLVPSADGESQSA